MAKGAERREVTYRSIAKNEAREEQSARGEESHTGCRASYDPIWQTVKGVQLPYWDIEDTPTQKFQGRLTRGGRTRALEAPKSARPASPSPT